jgi:hypothetical protein
MQWVQPFSRRAQRIVLAFGILILGSAALAGPPAWLPGLVMGGLWALTGWRGYPLIPSVSSNSPDTATGTRTIRIRRFIAMATPLSIIPCVSFMFMTAESYRMTVFVALVIPSMVALFYFAFSACPRCHQHFFVARTHSMWTQRCAHCDLSLNSAKQPNASLERPPGK